MQQYLKYSSQKQPNSKNGLIFFFFLCIIRQAVDGWHFEYPKWGDLSKQAHQHLAWLVKAEWFLPDTLSCCPVVGPDICLVGPSIGPNVFLQCFGFLGARYITDTSASWDLSQARRPGCQNGLGTGGGRIILLTFTEIWRFVKDSGWNICLLEGTEVFCQHRSFGLNIKKVFLCSLEIACFSN